MITRSGARRQLAEYSELVWRAGWVANHDGNLSLRVSGAADRFIITPTATSKRACRPETLVECDPSGAPVGRGRPPSEVALHVGAYAARADVRAVIHAHPPYVSAFALTGAELGPIGMPEVVVSLGAVVPRVPLYLPKDPEAGPATGAALGAADVAILLGNGAIAVGPDLETAYLRLELLEHYARIVTLARGGLGAPAPLEPSAVRRLLEMRRAAGLRVGPMPENVSEPRARPTHAGAGPATNLRELVAEELRRTLGGTSS